MDGLTEENKWSWFFKNLANLGNSRYKPYPTYSDPSNNGIFKIQNDPEALTTVAVLSDWASDTTESRHVAAQTGTNDYTIHLGDTYYVGNEKEIMANFYPENGGTWPYGTKGSFAMMGNHEMYSSGEAFFKKLLPRMGSYGDQPQVQQGAFFCLENDFWRIVGLDTGYQSLRGFLGLTPNENLDLTDEQKAWLTDIVKLNADNRGIIILSHHQCFSAFEKEFPNPAKFIASLLPAGRDVIWLWGHEHWFSVYGANRLDNGANVFGRCIGNSGMPVELKDSGENPKVPKSETIGDPVNRNLVLYDNRLREYIDATIPLGHNGYNILNLEGPKVTITYYDDNDMQPQSRKVLEEVWSIDTTTGKLTGESITDFTLASNFPFNLFSDDLSLAIKAV